MSPKHMGSPTPTPTPTPTPAPHRSLAGWRGLSAFTAIVLALPAVAQPTDLIVEWRWQTDACGIASGATLSSRDAQASAPFPSIVVKNGEPARHRTVTREREDRVDTVVGISPPLATTGTQGPVTNQPDLAIPAVSLSAVPRSPSHERTDGYEVRVRWPGGNRAVHLDVQAVLSDRTFSSRRQIQVGTAVDLPLNQWKTLVGSDCRATTAVAPGSLELRTRSPDAADRRGLQIRVRKLDAQD